MKIFCAFILAALVVAVTSYYQGKKAFKKYGVFKLRWSHRSTSIFVSMLATFQPNLYYTYSIPLVIMDGLT